jgi:hypothetical protein
MSLLHGIDQPNLLSVQSASAHLSPSALTLAELARLQTASMMGPAQAAVSMKVPVKVSVKASGRLQRPALLSGSAVRADLGYLAKWCSPLVSLACTITMLGSYPVYAVCSAYRASIAIYRQAVRRHSQTETETEGE